MNTYFLNYLMSYFRTNKTTTSAQLLHVLQGKRTPSMFYLTEINHWHHGFSTFPNITLQDLKKVIHHFTKKNGLIEVGKGYRLTEFGTENLTAYFEEFYFPKHITRFTNVTIRNVFWERYQLFTQVLSETSYENKRYVPIIKHPQHQESIRLLFQQFKTDKTPLLVKWIEEQQFLFSNLEEERASRLFSHLSGHEVVGNTKLQTQEKVGMVHFEYDFYHLDSIELILQCIKKHKKELPILYAMFKQLNEETFFGLSASTYQTFQLLLKGHTISEVARIRYLKENTIREHILEIAFVFDDFPYQKFIPQPIYEKLKKQFEKVDNLTYKEVVSANEDIEFMHYRLAELERMRKND